MPTTSSTPQIPPAVSRKVSRLRMLVRLYSLGEGVAAIGAIAGIAFWSALALDWVFELAPFYRGVMWGAFGVAAAAAAWMYVVRRTFAALPGESLALLVERHYHELREGLVTAVQAIEAPPSKRRDSILSGDSFNRALIEATAEQAAAALDRVRLAKVFNLRPLVRKSAIAVLLLLSVAAFSLVQQEAFALWLDRLRLSEQPWPRRVHLTVQRFEDREASNVVNVARNDEFTLNVFASLTDGHSAPDEVEIRWRRTVDGMRGGGPMTRIGDPTTGADAAQQYSYTFKVSSDLEFDVIGGDDRVRNLRLRAVERPAVTRIWLEIEYPAYMQREPRSIPISGRGALPEGARAVCRVEANKPLLEVKVRKVNEQTDVAASLDKGNVRQFSFPIEGRGPDDSFMITMRDADGVENRAPFRLPISIIPDEIPEITAQLRGIGSAVTPQANIPLNGKIQDDHGLREAWINVQVADAPAQRRPFSARTDELVEVAIDERLDLSETDPATQRPRTAVTVGERLTLIIQARDAYDLGGEPHIGSSQQMTLDVVSASELRALLEKRELGLRQRFEAIYERMLSVAELLDRIDLDAAAGGAEDKAASTENAGDSPAPASADRIRERDRARMDGAQQTTTQLAFETGGIADGFEDIVAELINNRVDTEELKERLEQGISEPLRLVSNDLLPSLEAQIDETLARYQQDPTTASSALASAKTEAAAAAEAMKAILDRMLELETYNEVVELLRGIVADQQQIREQTQQEQKQKLRGLLED